MKPRISLAEALLPDGTTLQLQQHDGRYALLVQGQQIAGAATRAAEEELARLAAAPFRPARQPKIWIAGLALGEILKSLALSLPQKRAVFHVAEPIAELPAWHRQHLADSPLRHDGRIVLETDPGPAGLARHAGSLHAILLHLDTAPLGPRNRPWIEEKGWLSAAYEALQQGGLLAIAATRARPDLTRKLVRNGFAVAEHSVPVSPHAKKPRLQPLWLARKGKAEE